MEGALSPPPTDEPPRWARIWLPLIVRIAVILIALRFALVASDPVALLGYCAIALGAAGFELAKWVR